MQQTQQLGELSNVENLNSKEGNPTFSSQELVLFKEKGPQKRGSNCLDDESVMVIYQEQLKEAEEEMAENIAREKGLTREKTRSAKLSSSKKEKRFCTYGAQS